MSILNVFDSPRRLARLQLYVFMLIVDNVHQTDNKYPATEALLNMSSDVAVTGNFMNNLRLLEMETLNILGTTKHFTETGSNWNAPNN